MPKNKRSKKLNAHTFQTLISKEKDQLYRMAFMYTRNEQDALELFQETLYKAYKNFHTLNQKEYFSTWIIKIQMNLFYDQLKKQKNHMFIPLDSFHESQLPFIKEDISIDEKIDLLSALSQLNHHNKTVLFLRFYKDLTVREISDILDYPEGTIKTHIHRALKQLKQVIGEGDSNEAIK